MVKKSTETAGVRQLERKLFARMDRARQYPIAPDDLPALGSSEGDGAQVMSTNNLSAAEYLIRNCTVAFKCRTRWQDLPDDGIESVRFCGECQKEVHLCTSEKDLREALLDNLCVAIEVRPQKSEMILGQVVLNRGA